MEIPVTDDYYALLGIDVFSGDAELRRAWRRLALRWHPDRAGVGATAMFQRIQAAYTVLSDTDARAAYDRRRGVSMRDPGSRPSDSTSTRTDAPGTSAPGVMLSRLSGPLNALLACGAAELAADGAIELFLSVQEASEGGMVSIAMRLTVRCPACSPSSASACDRCGTSRVVEELFSAWLAVPPGVSDGAVLTPSALLPGMVGTVAFRVRLA